MVPKLECPGCIWITLCIRVEAHSDAGSCGETFPLTKSNPVSTVLTSYNLVGGFSPTHSKKMQVRQNWIHFWQGLGWKQKKHWEPPPEQPRQNWKNKKNATGPSRQTWSCEIIYNLGFVSEWLTLGNSRKLFKEKNNHQNRWSVVFFVLSGKLGDLGKNTSNESPPVFFNNQLNAQKLWSFSLWRHVSNLWW